jgi:hypothetical protein
MINQIPKGSGSTSRAERSCLMKGVQIRGVYFAEPDTNGCASLLLVYDRDHANTSALPIHGDFVVRQSAYNSDVAAPNNADNAMRFKVIRRWDFNPGQFPMYLQNVAQDSGTTALGATTVQECQSQFEAYVPLKDKELSFTTDAVGS